MEKSAGRRLSARRSKQRRKKKRRSVKGRKEWMKEVSEGKSLEILRFELRRSKGNGETGMEGRNGSKIKANTK